MKDITLADKANSYDPNPSSEPFCMAHEFASVYGRRFAEFVLKDIDLGKKTHVAIMLNGAEHLGTLLDAYMGETYPNVNLKYLWLTQSVTGLRSGIDDDTREVGYWWDDPVNKHNDLAEYLNSQNVFECDQLIGVDTAHFGHSILKLQQIGRAQGYSDVQGKLLYRVTEPRRYDQTGIEQIKVHGLNEFMPDDRKKLYDWMLLLDGAKPASLSSTEDWRVDGRQIDRTKGVFQQSRRSPQSILQKGWGFRKSYIPDTPLFSDPLDIQAYADTVAGIRSGMESAR